MERNFFDFFAQNPFGEHVLPLAVTWLLLQRLELFKNDVLGHSWVILCYFGHVYCIMPTNLHYKKCAFLRFLAKIGPFPQGVHI